MRLFNNLWLARTYRCLQTVEPRRSRPLNLTLDVHHAPNFCVEQCLLSREIQTQIRRLRDVFLHRLNCRSREIWMQKWLEVARTFAAEPARSSRARIDFTDRSPRLRTGPLTPPCFGFRVHQGL